MCGIAGIYAYRDNTPGVDRAELLRIRYHMRSRGPDGEGLWVSEDRRIGLGHRRLAIIDLTEAGAQPMLDPDTGNCIVFNGEIYNYRALRSELEAAGQHFRSNSDTEVLLKLYARHGKDMLPKLRGMYAFAIWDDKQQDLFLARDPFGIKPLYYADDGQAFRFASQVKALLAGGQIDATPSPAGHAGFYLWGHVPEPYTLYQEIRALPAGTWLRLSQGKITSQRHFDIAETLAQAEQASTANLHADSATVLRQALLDSVAHHLVADVPVGLFLSAGLDSTTLLALASETKRDLASFTLGFREYQGTENDESPLAEQVARHYGATHSTRWVGRDDFSQDLDRLLLAMDQPSTDGVNTWFVAKEAAASGLKVALSGLGGDELFGSYPSFRQIPKLVQRLVFAHAMPALGRGFRLVSAPLLKHLTSPKWAGLLEYGGSYGGAYLLRRGHFMPWELPQIMEPDMARQGWQELQTLARLQATIDGLRTPHCKVAALEISWYMRNQLLRDTDWASMAHSIEIRVPLLDVALLKTVAPLVATPRPIDKSAMAHTPANPLPQAVLDRGKTGFSIPVHQWLAEIEAGQGQPMRGLRPWACWLMRSPAFRASTP